MIARRLHRQIYLTIALSLVLVVVLSAFVWVLTRGEREDRENFTLAARVSMLALAPASAPRSEQAASLRRMAEALEIEIGLFDAERRPIEVVGEVAPPDDDYDDSRWRRGPRGPGWALKLDDGRWLMLDFSRKGPRRSIFDLLLFLGAAAVAVGVGAYPFTRRLTRRLGRLREGVERIGGGDLSARVAVQGRDEVAALAESFNDAAAEIERLVEARRMLLAHASHELRTPLSRIRMGVEMSGAGGDPARRAALEADIAELDRLIDEILLTSRLDAKTVEIERRRVDLTALAAEECARYPDCDLEGEGGELTGDPTLLRRMIRNLLDNAFAHGAPPVALTLDRAAGRARIVVTDRGPGVSTDARERVFEPFHRGADRQNVKGYGLGLPLVRQIAEAHGGRVSLSDRSGGGTAAEVELPAPNGDGDRL
ncbi:MAG: HAMP domain-containing sensor histidine kinase [Pseudomonadota bacterium]